MGSQIAVLGAGLMGHAIAAVFARSGYSVTCVEPDPKARASLDDRVRAVLKQLPDLEGNVAAGEVLGAASPADLDPGTRLVVEAAPEKLDLKQDLFATVADECSDAILATNTSVFRVDDVAAKVVTRERVVGTHWWNPPHLMPLVEIVQGSGTAPQVIAEIERVLHAVGKQTVVVRRDTPGFIGNRLQHALWREAMALVEEGICTAEEVDRVVRSSIGLRLSAVGPLENADYVGLDLTLAIHEYVFPALNRSEVPLEILASAVREGRLGAKSGRGFFDWSASSRAGTQQRLADRVRMLTSHELNRG